MSITYTLEPRDLRAFQRYAQKHHPTHRRLRYFLAAWIVALCLWLALSTDDHRIGFRIAYFCVLLLVFWGLTRLFTLIASGVVQWRSYSSDKYKSVLCEHTVTLADDAFVEATAFNLGRNLWSGIYRVADTPDYVYVFVSLTMGHIIPKRAFPDTESARDFMREQSACSRKHNQSPANECVEPTAGYAFCFDLESLSGGGSRWRWAKERLSC